MYNRFHSALIDSQSRGLCAGPFILEEKVVHSHVRQPDRLFQEQATPRFQSRVEITAGNDHRVEIQALNGHKSWRPAFSVRRKLTVT